MSGQCKYVTFCIEQEQCQPCTQQSEEMLAGRCQNAPAEGYTILHHQLIEQSLVGRDWWL